MNITIFPAFSTFCISVVYTYYRKIHPFSASHILYIGYIPPSCRRPCITDIPVSPHVFLVYRLEGKHASEARPEGATSNIAQGNRRRSESRAELAPAIPSEEEEDEVIALGWSTAAKCALQGQKHGHKGQNVPTRKTFQCRAVSLCFWHEIMPFSAVILSISR